MRSRKHAMALSALGLVSLAFAPGSGAAETSPPCPAVQVATVNLGDPIGGNKIDSIASAQTKWYEYVGTPFPELGSVVLQPVGGNMELIVLHEELDGGCQEVCRSGSSVAILNTATCTGLAGSVKDYRFGVRAISGGFFEMRIQ